MVWSRFRILLSKVIIYFKLTWISSFNFPTHHTFFTRLINRQQKNVKMQITYVRNVFVTKNDIEVLIYNLKVLTSYDHPWRWLFIQGCNWIQLYEYFLRKGFCARWTTYKQKTQTTSSYKQPKITKTQN